jgi:hypothetical protein
VTNYDDDNDDLDNDQQPVESKTPNWRRKLEADAEEGRAAKERAAQLERRLAISEAGLTSLTPQQRELLENGYKGEWTAEKVREFAEGAGFTAPKQQTSTNDADLAALDKVSQASQGAGIAPQEDAVAGLYAADRQGGRAALIEKLRTDGIVNVE